MNPDGVATEGRGADTNGCETGSPAGNILPTPSLTVLKLQEERVGGTTGDGASNGVASSGV